MSFKEKNKSLIDSISTLVLATLALIFSLKVFPLAIFLFPIPFIVLGVNYNIKNSVMSIIISSIIIGIALDPYSAIIILGITMPLAVSISIMIKKEYEPSRLLLVATIIFLLSLFILIFVAARSADIDIIEKTDELFKINFNNQIELLKDSGMDKLDIENLKNTLDIVRENILVTLPSIFIILSTAIAYINYLLSTVILSKDGYSLKNKPVFSKFKLPRSIFLGTLLMFIFSYVLNLLNVLNGEGIIRNLIVLVTFIFSIQGLSVLDYLMKKRGTKTFGRVFTIMLLVFLLPLGSLMAFLGILDSIIDFRKFKGVK